MLEPAALAGFFDALAAPFDLPLVFVAVLLFVLAIAVNSIVDLGSTDLHH